MEDPSELDVAAFEKEELGKIGMPQAITMRHRIPHFQHIFSGDGYAAGYYSYMWSEVMDADAFEAFEEKGNVFDPETAGKLLTYIYSAGGRQDPEAAYLSFRGVHQGSMHFSKSAALLPDPTSSQGLPACVGGSNVSRTTG